MSKVRKSKRKSNAKRGRGRPTNAERIERGKAAIDADPELRERTRRIEHEIASSKRFVDEPATGEHAAMAIDAGERTLEGMQLAAAGPDKLIADHERDLMLAIAVVRVRRMLEAESGGKPHPNVQRAAEEALGLVALWSGYGESTVEASRGEAESGGDRRDGPASRALVIVAKVAKLSVSSVRRAVKRWGPKVRPGII